MTQNDSIIDPAPDPKVSAVDDQQIIYYEGAPKLRGEIGTLMVWTLVGLIFIAIPFLLGLAVENLPWYVYAIGFVFGIACWIMPSLLVRRNYYRITNYRIDYESGLIFKKLDTLELWHVNDVTLRQGPLDRIFNVGTITVMSHDATNPQLQLKSLGNPRKLLETLKTRIIAVKRQRGVVKIDTGDQHHHDPIG